MNIEILASNFGDNYFYLVHDGSDALLIDPVDAQTAIAAVEASGCTLQTVVNTHWHPDHVAGNDAVVARFPEATLVAGPDHERIAGDFDRVLADADDLVVGAMSLRVWEAPGHTEGHIVLSADDHLFSGDVIFVCGAGHCKFGGDPGVLYRTYRDVLNQFGDNVTFYPGHDYAKRNFEFALSLQPDHEAARAALAAYSGATPHLATLGQERRYSPFFRAVAGDPELQDALESQHPALWAEEQNHSEDARETAFRVVRMLRNNW